MSYFLIWLFTVIEQLESMLMLLAIVGVCITSIVHFRWAFTMVNGITYSPNYDDEESTFHKWKGYASNVRKKLLSWVIICYVLTVIIPTKKDLAIIIVAGKVGSYVMHNEDIKGIPDDVFKYIKGQLTVANHGVSETINNFKKEGVESVKDAIVGKEESLVTKKVTRKK